MGFEKPAENEGSFAGSMSKWMRVKFGDEVMLRVVHVILSGTATTDSEFKEIAECSGASSDIQQLNVSYTKITDLSLPKLEHFPNLKTVFIDNTNTTDDGLRFLEKLTKLECIGLGRQHITPEGLKHLSRVKNLKVVYLDFYSQGLGAVVAEGLPGVAVIQ